MPLPVVMVPIACLLGLTGPADGDSASKIYRLARATADVTHVAQGSARHAAGCNARLATFMNRPPLRGPFGDILGRLPFQFLDQPCPGIVEAQRDVSPILR